MKEKLVFKTEGLTCPHCSAEIAEEIKKNLPMVADAEVNIISEEMYITLEGDCAEDKLLSDIRAIVGRHEPDVKVSLKESGEAENESEEDYEKELNKKIKLGIAGAALFLASFLPYFNEFAKTALLLSAYAIFGYDVLHRAVRNILKGEVFDENFLMSLSTIGALAIGEMHEAVFVMMFYQVGEAFQDLAVHRSRKSIRSLMDIRPDYANVFRHNEIIKTDPKNVHIDEVIVVKAGERIPLDGVVAEGKSFVDTSALTGESVPREVSEGSEVLSGTINTNGLLKIRVAKTYDESAVSKILELIENASSKKSSTEKFITRFAKIYTPAVVLAACLIAAIPPMFTAAPDFGVWFSRALIFLVVSCPCALVLSVPLGFFSGIGQASARGILIKGSSYLQTLEEADTIVFDKTGTLTQGVFEVSDVLPSNGFSHEEIIKTAALSEKMSNHPMAKSIVSYYEGKYGTLDSSEISEWDEKSGLGVSAVIFGRRILAGNKTLMDENKITIPEALKGSVVYIAIDGVYAGAISVSDKLKSGSAEAIAQLKKMGIENIFLLTGDSRHAAEDIGDELGIMSVYAELLPWQKVEKIDEIYTARPESRIIFVGDGINDAPVLARVDVGIAMGGIGSDAAIEAADVVIMNDELSKISEAINISRKTDRIVRQNIIFCLIVKAGVLALGAFGAVGMWEAAFADVGVAFIAILNSMRNKI